MKIKTFGSVIALVVSICVISCTEDQSIDNSVVPASRTTTRAADIDPRHLEIIEALGFSTDSIVEQDDYYIVEGDITIEKDSIWLYLPEVQTRQGGYKSRITKGREDGIRIKISSNNVPDVEWRRAAKKAADIWSNIPDCRVDFDKITNTILPHDVKVMMDRSVGVAAGSIPQGGKPVGYVRINPDIPWKMEEKIYIMVHELGHILGLAHTDYIANYYDDPVNHSYDDPSTINYITGTPSDEENSVMFSHGAGRRWGDWGFDPWGELASGRLTDGDILAIQRMYGIPDYSISVVGEETLLPGNIATYHITCPSLLQGYTGDFETTWHTAEEVLSQTDTSITIRCRHSVLHPVILTAASNYNGVMMSDSHTVNAAQDNNCQALRRLLQYHGFSTAQITAIMSGGTYAGWRQTAKNLNVVSPGLADYIFDNPNTPTDVDSGVYAPYIYASDNRASVPPNSTVNYAVGNPRPDFTYEWRVSADGGVVYGGPSGQLNYKWDFSNGEPTRRSSLSVRYLWQNNHTAVSVSCRARSNSGIVSEWSNEITTNIFI